jgi:hypothetical protein
VHEYLSHIDYDNLEIRQIALENTIAKYGSLFHRNKINEIVLQVNVFLKENSDFFNKDNWNKVFNEYTIFDGNNKESRIDRLMINTKEKKILILDYKTGIHFEQEQLDKYKEIVDKLPLVKKDKYRVDVKFIEVKVGNPLLSPLNQSRT